MIRRISLRQLRGARSGIAAVEFALTLPVVMAVGGYGLEVANYALANERVSQIALSAADNASRVGATSALATQQLREIDINDVFQAARLQGQRMRLTSFGRMTISSLRRNSSGGQWIEWQRCAGTLRGTGWDSSYGTEGMGATGTAFAGMGPADRRITAPPNSAVIFVEVNYQYRPLLGDMVTGNRRLHYVASFIVRDQRVSGAPTNPSPAVTASSCTAHSV